MFIGEGPGADEDTQGIPFVGRAGQLLDKIVEAMGLVRNQIYIANVVKCRPPGNRAPLPEETAECVPFLRAQIEAIHPRVIVALGAAATATLVGDTASLTQLRGKFHPSAWFPDIPVMPTFHPAYLLRTPSAKKETWEDMKLVMAKLKENP